MVFDWHTARHGTQGIGECMRLAQQRRRVRELKSRVSELEKRTFSDVSDVGDSPGPKAVEEASQAD